MSDESAVRRVLIVVPAWNEEAAVGQTVREIFAEVPGVDVLVVDDGSVDLTAKVAREAGARVLELPYNLGVGGAMRAGFRYALRHDYSAVVQVDADGQHRPACVPALLAKLDEFDVVIGSRFENTDNTNQYKYIVHGPRKWAMSVMANVLSRLAKTPLNDVTSGFRATGPRALVLFAEYFPAEYLGDTIESLVIALRVGCRVGQVPVDMRPRLTGAPSKNFVKSALYLMRANFALLLALMRRWKVPTPQARTGAAKNTIGPLN